MEHNAAAIMTLTVTGAVQPRDGNAAYPYSVTMTGSPKAVMVAANGLNLGDWTAGLEYTPFDKDAYFRDGVTYVWSYPNRPFAATPAEATVDVIVTGDHGSWTT